MSHQSHTPPLNDLNMQPSSVPSAHSQSAAHQQDQQQHQQQQFTTFDDQHIPSTPPFDTSFQSVQSPPPSIPSTSFLHPEHARRISLATVPTNNHSFAPDQSSIQPFSADYSTTTNDLTDFGSINPQLLTTNGASDNQFDFDSSLVSDNPQDLLEGYQDTPVSQPYHTGDMSSFPSQSSPAQMLQPYHSRSRNASVSSVRSAGSHNYGNIQPFQHSPHPSVTPSHGAYGSMEHNPWASSPFTAQQQAMTEDNSDFISSQQPSPFLGYNDGFIPSNGHSPFVNPSQDLPDDLNFNAFNLADGDAQFSTDFNPNEQMFSPYNTINQSIETSFNPNDVGLGFAIPAHMQQQPVVYPSHEAFPQFVHQESLEMSPGATMSPPEIAIDFAPPQKQPSFPMPLYDESSVPSANPTTRRRSSTTASGNRDASTHRGRPRNISLTVPGPQRSSSRTSSPGLTGSGVSKPQSRRSSTSRIENVAHIAEEIALRRNSTASNISNISEVSHSSFTNGVSSRDPSPCDGQMHPRLGSNGLKQKNPSNFHCKLCDKSFTRAYNLRSHERTHTNERPFVCNTCGKTFARQHDRKRHEQLHTGIKKFVCKGTLKDGSAWGCGKGFARADALGRHFKSEQGRMCILPLFGEEELERGTPITPVDPSYGLLGMGMPGSGGNTQQQFMQQPGPMMQPVQHQAGMFDMSANGGIPTLPASLLQLYPALADLQWNQMGDAGFGDEEYLSGMEGTSEVEYVSGEEEEGAGDMMNGNGGIHAQYQQGMGVYGNGVGA